jgi:hypothetical protein
MQQRRMALVVALSAVVVVLLAWVASAEPASLWREFSLPEPEFDTGRVTETTAPAPTVPAEDTDLPDPVDIGWLVQGVLLLLGLLALVAVIWWLSTRTWRRPQRRLGMPFTPLPEIAPEELLDAADEFDMLIARGSARNAIVACWVRLEEAVEQAGLVRNPSETATEMTARVLRSYAVDAGPIGSLAALYREARFSAHDMGEDHRRRAQDALAEIRRQLRDASAPTDAASPT